MDKLHLKEYVFISSFIYVFCFLFSCYHMDPNLEASPSLTQPIAYPPLLCGSLQWTKIDDTKWGEPTHMLKFSYDSQFSILI